MKIRRQLTGVLHSFLDQFTGRYSDYDGWWMFGLFVPEYAVVVVDLIQDEISVQVQHGSAEKVYRHGRLVEGTSAEREPAPAVLAAAADRARECFAGNVAKSCVPAEFVSGGTVTIRRSEKTRGGLVNDRFATGWQTSFLANVASDLGRHYAVQKTIFVAPWNASLNYRSARRLS